MKDHLERSVIMNEKKMTDKEYLLFLRDKQTEMRIDILKCCLTQKKTIFVYEFEIYKMLKGKYNAGNIKENEENVILKGVLQNQIAFLTAQGKLVSGAAKYGIGYRTAIHLDEMELVA